MKEMIIRVPDESVPFVEEFLEKIGGDIAKPGIRKNVKKSKVNGKNSFDDVFGIWKNENITLDVLRERAWQRMK